MVHFTAAWCVPSVAMNPFFKELALCYQDILFLSVDVDDVKVFLPFPTLSFFRSYTHIYSNLKNLFYWFILATLIKKKKKFTSFQANLQLLLIRCYYLF